MTRHFAALEALDCFVDDVRSFFAPGWERLGSNGVTWRERNHQGWTALLPHFVRAATPVITPMREPSPLVDDE